MSLFKKFIAVFIATAMSVVPAEAVLGPDAFPAAFDELLKIPSLSNPAMIMIDGTTGQVVYQRNAYSQRKPASVMKILAAAATIEYLDLESNFNTDVSIAADEKTIVIRGSLDPWISPNHTVGRKMGRASLPHMATSTLNAVKAANGGSLKNYTVMYSNLYSQDVTSFKTFWAKRGFKPVMKSVNDETAFMAGGLPIASENSPTTNEILTWTLLWSDNTLSERLARLSAKSAGYSMSATGVNLVFRNILSKFNVDDTKLVVADASGLSKKNRITAMMMGELLYQISKDEKFAAIRGQLPVSGISGTLHDRFITTAPTAVGLVRAKTGSLNGTATLAGYVEATDREYIFVTLADEIPKGTAALKKARAAIDRVLGRVAAPNIPAEISAAP